MKLEHIRRNAKLYIFIFARYVELVITRYALY